MTDKNEPTLFERQMHPGAMSLMLSHTVHQHARELDRVTEELLIAHFGSLEQAIARSTEFDVVFDRATVQLLDEGTDDVILRFEETIRIKMKEKP